MSTDSYLQRQTTGIVIDSPRISPLTSRMFELGFCFDLFVLVLMTLWHVFTGEWRIQTTAVHIPGGVRIRQTEHTASGPSE